MSNSILYFLGPIFIGIGATLTLDIAGFLRLVIEALKAAGVEYLIGGAIAE
jgi:hypothetical protein